MAMSVVYTTINGEILHEVRNGVEHYYVPDTNGNTVQLLDAAGNKTDEWTYWPFGEVRTRTGTTATPFTFGGVLGYYLDMLGTRMYIRARYLRQALARWQTVDPLWPAEPAYAYGIPTYQTDKSGLKPQWHGLKGVIFGWSPSCSVVTILGQQLILCTLTIFLSVTTDALGVISLIGGSTLSIGALILGLLCEAGGVCFIVISIILAMLTLVIGWLGVCQGLFSPPDRPCATVSVSCLLSKVGIVCGTPVLGCC